MEFDVVIGLEVHCQLQTESKIFATDPNRFGVAPNTNIGVISLAYPGVLPKLNKKAVEYAVKLGLACHCDINENQYFDRKNYFYPDLPKGYQITQDKTPICLAGYYDIRYKNAAGQETQSRVQIHHIHLEEDAGKSVHIDGEKDTLLDYNRAGTPLVEMVTEPCISSGEEAAAYMAEMRRLVRYLGISDGNMEEGSLRCDVNISLKPKGSAVFGTKVEIKNMNSMKFIQKAIEYEIVRQKSMLQNGEKIIQETRSFDPATNTTAGMREKETMNDYRYFPEPDLPPFQVGKNLVDQIKTTMPALPNDLYARFKQELGLSHYDASQLIDQKEIADYFELLIQFTTNTKAAANWINGAIKAHLNETGQDIADFMVKPAKIAQLIALVDEGKISNTAANQNIFSKLVQNPELEPATIAINENLIQESNTDALQALVDEVLEAFPDKVKEYKQGKKGLLAMFMGEVMKKSKGKADPKLTSTLIAKSLG